MQEKLAAYFAVLLYSAGAVGLIWLGVRFLLPWAAPFILAWLLAAALEAPVGFLQRRGWRRSAASGLCTLTFLGLLLWAMAALLWQGLDKLSDFAREVPALMEAVTLKLGELEALLQSQLNDAPEGGAMFLEMAGSTLTDALSSLPALISKAAVGFLTRTAQASPNTLLFIITAAIGTYFVSSSFPRINAFLLAQLPTRLRERLAGLGADLKSSFGGVLRSQLILMALTFFQLLLSFWWLGVDSALELAAVTAVVDALPVFGTGAVLMPWALCCLLLGDMRRGLGLIVCWLVISVLRNVVQAKLMGSQIGLEPLASLMSIYVGWRVWGVGGMLLFPILLVTLQQLNERGIIHLWKSV